MAHRRDAGEVAGAPLAAQRLLELADLDERLRARGVHRGRVGAEREVDAGATGLRQITGLVTRILREVLGGRELRRVDEDRQDHDVGAGPRVPHEGEVALVERAHGWHDRDPPAIAPQVGDAGAHLVRGPVDLERDVHAGMLAHRPGQQLIASTQSLNLYVTAVTSCRSSNPPLQLI